MRLIFDSMWIRASSVFVPAVSIIYIMHFRFAVRTTAPTHAWTMLHKYYVLPKRLFILFRSHACKQTRASLVAISISMALQKKKTVSRVPMAFAKLFHSPSISKIESSQSILEHVVAMTIRCTANLRWKSNQNRLSWFQAVSESDFTPYGYIIIESYSK